MNWFTRPRSQDEWDDFTLSPPYGIDCDPLKWWSLEAQKVRWPTLSVLATELLSIPAMSDEPERVFSGGRRTVSWERAQMSPSELEKNECLKSWIRSGICFEIED